MQRYEERRWKLTTIDNTSAEDDKGNCISYFCPTTPDYETFPEDWVKGYKEGSPKVEVTGKEKLPHEIYYDKVVDLNLVMSKIQDYTFTKKKTKDAYGRMVRQTLRKDCEAMKPWDVYTLSSLMQYARQGYAEGSKSLILSWNECKFLGI
ncbi:conserved hypothetical protein [Vibrio phage 277E43-1]|nr:conserved hypothetical protein [Vibrio phage 277E43-1]